MTRDDTDDELLTARLREALEADALRHPLPHDYASSLARSLRHGAPRRIRSMTTTPAAVGTVVVAVAAAALVLALSPRLLGPVPGSSLAPAGSPFQTPDERADIDCQLNDRCADVANAASPLLPPGVANWVILPGRARGQLHAEVHACYPDGRYLMVDVFDAADPPGVIASLRAEPWSHPPCRRMLPQPTCAPPPQVWRIDANGNEVPIEVTLTCEKAVEAAVAALPPDHLPILAVAFQYGNYCPPGISCPFSGSPNGYVVFSLQARGADLWVRVRADRDGNVSVAGGPSPYPPPSLFPRDQ